MSKQEINGASFDAEWASLSPDEQEACAIFSASEWSSGMDEQGCEMMGISKAALDALVMKGFVQNKTFSEYGREYIDTNKTRYDSIKSRQDGIGKFNPPLTEEESEFKSAYEHYVKSVTDSDTMIRYRLKSEAFHKFANTKLEDDDEE